MTESSQEQPVTPEQIAWDKEYNRRDTAGYESTDKIIKEMGPRPKSDSPLEKTSIVSSDEYDQEDSNVVHKADPRYYDRDVLAQAHEDLSSGKRDNFNGLNQGDIAAEIDRRYQEDLNAQSTQAQADKDDVVR